MLKDYYSFDDLSFSSQLIRDLIQENIKIDGFINRFFDLDKIKDQIAEKSFSLESRAVLVDALVKQNSDLELSQASKLNVESLTDENTFTITTGHQLNLLSGPLYSIYKIVQIISLTQELNKKNPENKFVPVFWMATEDHDFEEINHINLFNHKQEWQKKGQDNHIAGRINTADINTFLTEIEGKYSDDSELSIVKEITNIYKQSNNLAEATKVLMNHLFSEYGLVIIDGDDVELKKLFKKVFIKEVNSELVFKNVNKSNSLLESKGYHQQVYVRECNLFFISESGERIRIVKEGASFVVGPNSFTAQELSVLVEKNPENYSPNALLRPVYQETILPNLAYIGGGGEIAYWLQLKGIFKELGLAYPMLRVRDSILLVNSKQSDLMKQYDVSLMDLKLGVHQLIKEMAMEASKDELDISLTRELLVKAKKDLNEKANKINNGLGGMIEAEFAKFSKSIDRIESKLIKAEKSKFEQVEKKLNKLAQQFFPDGGFQERYENFLPYYVHSKDFVNYIVSNIPAENIPKIRILIKD